MTGQIYREAFKKLKPGGYIEILDFDDHTGLLGFYDSDSEVPRWLQATVEGARRAGVCCYHEVNIFRRLILTQVSSGRGQLPIWSPEV